MKKFISVLFVFLFAFNLIVGCNSKKDYSEYPFVNIRWTRSTENDTEFIRFSDDGEFSYYCACGNPVNDSDLCNGFSYNPDTETITLDYIEKTKETVTKVIIKKSSADEFVLDFDGDIRTFQIEEENSVTDTITYEGNEYCLIEYNLDIFNYDLTTGGDYEEDVIYPIEHSEWNIVYYNGDLFALEADLDEVNLYYSDDENYNWWVRVENKNTEYQYTLDLSLSESEMEYLYRMEEMERNETIFFEDIEQFATFAKTSKDGLITATIELVWRDNNWYWRSGIINESVEGWPEFIFEVPETLNSRIVSP